MITTRPNGFHGEGRVMCPDCAQRIYGESLELYLRSRDVEGLYDEDRQPFARKGLVCDECFTWIFQPDETEDPWWRKEPDPAEHAQMLAPFASYLETLSVDVFNLREV